MEMGAYLGDDPTAVAAYEAWLGHPLDDVLFYLNQTSWSAFDSSVSWAVALWQPVDRPVIWSVPLTVDGTSLAAVGQGLEDAHFLQAAEQLAATRPGDATIEVRLGWEFNGSWMPWAAQGQEAAFKKAYQTVVDEFRSVSDRFRFVWDVNVGGSYNPAAAYPGDNYVDAIGADFYYNTAYDPANPATAFKTKANEVHGLQWIYNFAAQHDKAFGISEWGVQTNSPAYVKAAATWFKSHDVAFANYWESDAAGYDGTLDNGSKPAAAAAYLNAFGSTTAVAKTSDLASGLVLRVSADAFEGDAQFTVSVNGKVLNGVYSTHADHSAGAFDTITIAGDYSDASTVAVTFINDAFQGDAASDRNLYVDSISVAGKTINGDQATNFAGGSIGTAAGLYVNGSAEFSVTAQKTNSLSIDVSEDAFRGDAEFKVFVDGAEIGGVQTAQASHALGQTQDVTITGLFAASPNVVRVEFLNDLYLGDASSDRNLYVSQLTVDGHSVDGSTGVNGAGSSLGSTAALYSNGSLVFHAATSGWS